jgi:hypothetical protein
MRFPGFRSHPQNTTAANAKDQPYCNSSVNTPKVCDFYKIKANNNVRRSIAGKKGREGRTGAMADTVLLIPCEKSRRRL